MTKKTAPSLNHPQSSGKNFKTRVAVWVLLVCVVTGVVFAVRQSRRGWPVAQPSQPAPVVKQDLCLDHLTQCQQEKMQLALRIQEAQNTRTQAQTFALSMRLAQLLNEGKPFQSTLLKLQSELPAQPELTQLSEKLADYAQQGVPTLSKLEKRLERLANKQDVSPKKVEDTWYSKIWNYVSTMVTVRPVQFSNCKDDTCRIYEAKQVLQKGKLTEAIKILKQIQQTEATEQLLNDMQARAFVESYLTQFTTTKEVIQ